jgi:transcriptional regulator GlxA family with amidase domain
MVPIWFVVLQETLLLDLAGPAEVFRIANQAARNAGLQEPFALKFCGSQARVRSSIGLSLEGLLPLPTARQIAHNIHPNPTPYLVLMGRPGEFLTTGRNQPDWLSTRNWLMKEIRPLLSYRQIRVVTVCEGALLAADAGLLIGTTHHDVIPLLGQLSPQSEILSNKVFVVDDPIYSSAGITAGIDLALHIVSLHCGELLAAQVAQTLVLGSRRTSASSAQSPLFCLRAHLHPALHRVQDAVAANVAQRWSIQKMAAVACVTPRHLGRLFLEHTGVTARQYLEAVRLAKAREGLSLQVPLVLAAQSAGLSARQLQAALLRATRR